MSAVATGGRVNLHIHRKLSLLAGFRYPMPENYESRSKAFRIFWRLYVCVPQALMIVELISQAVQITLSIDNVEGLTTCTLSTLYIVQFLLKMAVFKRNEKNFERIFSELQIISRTLMENPFGDGGFLELFDSNYKTVLTIGLWKGCLQLACNLGLNILFCVLSWVGMKPKITPAFSWTPYDSSKNPAYTLTCMFEMICYGSVTARTGVFDLLFWVMIVVPTVQLNYLKHLMGIMVTEKEDEGCLDDEATSSQLDWWTKTHQRTLRNVEEFQRLASPFLAVNYIASLIDLFMSGFVAMSSTHWDIFQRTLINAIIMADAFQLYVVSLAGDRLRESCENVADDGFSALIFKLKRDFRQHYLYVLSRTRRLLIIRFGGIYPLSTQTFSKLIQLTLTYFVTVIQIKNSQSNKSEKSVIQFKNSSFSSPFASKELFESKSVAFA